MPALEIISPIANQLGESPIWDPKTQQLYWIDGFKPALYCYDPANKSVKEVSLNQYVGASVMRAMGGLIATTQYGIASIDANSGAMTPLLDLLPTTSKVRMNDAACDRQGHLGAGSAIDQSSNPLGSLFCIHPELNYQQSAKGFLISNGIGFPRQ
jgi:L-arabinonolactonase